MMEPHRASPAPALPAPPKSMMLRVHSNLVIPIGRVVTLHALPEALQRSYFFRFAQVRCRRSVDAHKLVGPPLAFRTCSLLRVPCFSTGTVENVAAGHADDRVPRGGIEANGADCVHGGGGMRNSERERKQKKKKETPASIAITFFPEGPMKNGQPFRGCRGSLWGTRQMHRRSLRYGKGFPHRRFHMEMGLFCNYPICCVRSFPGWRFSGCAVHLRRAGARLCGFIPCERHAEALVGDFLERCQREMDAKPVRKWRSRAYLRDVVVCLMIRARIRRVLPRVMPNLGEILVGGATKK